MGVRFPVLLLISRLLRGLGILIFVIGVLLAIFVVYAAGNPPEPRAYPSFEGTITLFGLLWAGYTALIGILTVALAEMICVWLAVEENTRITGMKFEWLARTLSQAPPPKGPPPLEAPKP